MAPFHPFLWPSNIRLYTYTASLRIPLSMAVVAIVNSASVDIEMPVSIQIVFFSGYMPKSGIAGSYSNLFLVS